MALNVTSLADFAAAPDATAWNALLAGAPADPVFGSRAFQQTWWNAFCNREDCCCCCQLHLLEIRDGGTLVGVAPFYLAAWGEADRAEEQARAGVRQRLAARAPAAAPAGAADAPPAPGRGDRVVRLVGGVAVTDYLDLVVPVTRAEEAWDAVMAYWAAHVAQWDVLDLHSLAPESAHLARGAAARQGLAPWLGLEETCPAIHLPGDWATYQAGLSKKDRHELRRKIRRAEANDPPPTWRLTTGGPELAVALEEFIALHRLSGTAKAQFMTPAMAAFFRRLLSAFSDHGLEITTLYTGGRPAAAYLSFRQGSRLLLYNSGHDPQYGTWGAGFVLLAYRIERAIAQGVEVFDFLRGDERYKYDLGAEDHFLYRVIIRK